MTAPAGLATGTYTASVAVVDPTGYLAPMALANTSRLSDGSYRLGRVGVAYQRPHHLAPGLSRPARRTRRPPTGIPVGGRLPCGPPPGWLWV